MLGASGERPYPHTVVVSKKASLVQQGPEPGLHWGCRHTTAVAAAGTHRVSCQRQRLLALASGGSLLVGIVDARSWDCGMNTRSIREAVRIHTVLRVGPTVSYVTTGAAEGGTYAVALWGPAANAVAGFARVGGALDELGVAGTQPPCDEVLPVDSVVWRKCPWGIVAAPDFPF